MFLWRVDKEDAAKTYQEKKQVGKGGVKDERKEMDRYEENGVTVLFVPGNQKGDNKSVTEEF